MIRLIFTDKMLAKDKIPIYIAWQLKNALRISAVNTVHIYHENTKVGTYLKTNNNLEIDKRFSDLFIHIKNINIKEI